MTIIDDPDYWARIADDGASQNSEGLLVTFFTQPVQNRYKSQIEGRPVFDAVPFVRIRIAGSNSTEVERKVKEEDKKRWPEAWAAYQRREQGVVGGTPINQWPELNVVQVAELKALNIMTVEALAELSDAGISKLGTGGRDLVKRAKQYLAGPKSTEKALRAEVAELKQLVSQLQAQLRNAVRENDEAAKADEAAAAEAA